MQEGDVFPLEFLQATGDNNAVYYYHPNHLSSSMYVTDAQQSVVQSFLYAPYGDIISEYNTHAMGEAFPKYSFNAKELDEETGMYYYEARYYAPPTFISRDPLMSEKPWLTPYHYCSNNPVGKVDPSGMMDDWYQSKDGDVKWAEGHASTIVDVNGKRYRNIGETYSKQNADGSFSNYYQNIVFTSRQKFNAKEYILKNGLVGKYISNDSPLSKSSKTELLQASIYNAQNSFIRQTVEGTADICNKLGTAFSGTGIVAMAVPGGQVVGGSMVVIGSKLSSIGALIDGLVNFADGNYMQTIVSVTNYFLGKGTDKLWISLNVTPNQKYFLQGKSNLQNSMMTDIINNGIEKKQSK